MPQDLPTLGRDVEHPSCTPKDSLLPLSQTLLQDACKPSTRSGGVSDTVVLAVAIPHGTSQLVPSQSLGMEWSPTQAEQGYTIGLSQMAGFDSTDSLAVILLQVHLQQPCYDFCFL